MNENTIPQPQLWTNTQLEIIFNERLARIAEDNKRDLHEAVARLDQKSKGDDKALDLALRTLDDRLAKVNEFRLALTDQSATFPSRNEMESNISSLEARLQADIAPLAIQIDATKRTNWPLLLSFGVIAGSLITGTWFVIGLKIDSAIAPIELNINQLKTENAGSATLSTNLNTNIERLNSITSASSQADLASREDRAQLNVRMRNSEVANAQALAEQKSGATETIAKLTEIETQFRAISMIFNLQKDNVQQWLSVLWQQVFPGRQMPAAYYRPEISAGSVK